MPSHFKTRCMSKLPSQSKISGGTKKKKKKKAKKHAPAPPPPPPPSHLTRYMASPPTVLLPPAVELPIFCSSTFAVQWGKLPIDLIMRQLVHGLWQYPEEERLPPIDLRSGDASCYEPDLKLFLEQIMPCLPRRAIPNPTFQDHLNFWQHEWLNHGRYYGVTLEDYFNIIHFLYAHLSLDPLVMGLRPGLTLEVQNIQDSIQTNFGVKPELMGRAVGGGTVHIEEFRYRVNNNLQFVDNTEKDYSGDIKSVNQLVIVP